MTYDIAEIKDLRNWVDGLIINDAPNVSKNLRELLNGTKHIKITYPHSIIRDAADTIDCLLIHINRMQPTPTINKENDDETGQ